MNFNYDVFVSYRWVEPDQTWVRNELVPALNLHVLVRGKADDGRDLVISRDYISRGIRTRAQDRVTVELGPKPEHEIRSALAREVEADRWTQLDAVLRRRADETGYIDLRLVERVEPQPRLPTPKSAAS